MTEHRLKCVGPHYEEVASGRKTFEIRISDRNWTVGDVIRLREFKEFEDGTGGDFTGRECCREITHILLGPIYGLATGWVILSLAVVA